MARPKKEELQKIRRFQIIGYDENGTMVNYGNLDSLQVAKNKAGKLGRYDQKLQRVVYPWIYRGIDCEFIVDNAGNRTILPALFYASPEWTKYGDRWYRCAFVL